MKSGFTLVEIVVVLLLLGILGALAAHRFTLLNAESKGIDAALAELGARERLVWGREKLSAAGWISDAAVFAQMDPDLGADYSWVGAPAPGGGTLRFRNETAPLTRSASTSANAARWRR